MNYLQAEVLHATARALAAAPHGGKQAILEGAAAQLNLSPKRVYALLKEHAEANGRKRRADANTTAITDADLTLIAGVLSEGRRANGKEMFSVERAIEMLHANGKLSVKLSPSRVSALMKQRFAHPDMLAKPTASVSMQTEHPNAVWQIDASVCVLYRAPGGEVKLMEREAFYKNKLHNVARVMNDLLTRYVGTDHCSGSVGVRLCLGGETTENALEFLMWLMSPRLDAQGRTMPFHGVPFTLYTDQGSAFKAGPFVNFCKVMGIELLHHRPRNARATGSVESANNIFERSGEAVLRYMDQGTLTMAALNMLADHWMAWFNSMRRHRRHGMSRFGCWNLIRSEQLRLAPDIELMRELPASEPERRRVTNDMTVSFATRTHGSHQYDVRHVRGAAPALTVQVAVNPFSAPAVNVGVTDLETGEVVWHLIEPIVRNEFGFDVASPILGKTYHPMPLTVVDEQRNAIARQAYATAAGPATLEEADKARRTKVAPYAGQFDPLADMKAAVVPIFLPRAGVPSDVVVRQMAVPVLSTIDACKRLKDVLRDAYNPKVYGWVAQRFPDGVPEDQLDQIAAQFGAPEPQQPDAGERAPLRAVGGAT